MLDKYDQTRHLKLLKSSLKLKGPETKITDKGFLEYQATIDETIPELAAYSSMMNEHLHWQNREHYFELIEKLLSGPLHFLELRSKFHAIDDVVNSLQANLIIFEPDSRSDEFALLIGDIIMLFDRYSPDPISPESDDLSEEELKDVIQKIFIELKERYPVNSKENI